MDKELEEKLCQKGRELQECLPRFFGKVTFNYSNGLFSNANVEQSIRPENLNERKSKCSLKSSLD